MRRQLAPAVVLLALFTVVLGLAYPLTVTAVAQAGAGWKADGSLIEVDGRLVGSALVGQASDRPDSFQPRPSATGYDAGASGASNLGPASPTLVATVAERVAVYRRHNGLAPDTPVPVDAVTASASGLDRHISPANARLQAPRVAQARGLDLAEVLALIEAATDERPLGVLGDPGVDVLALNLSLDRAGRS